MSGTKAHGLQVFKAADGTYWWLSVSSTAFADRDQEIVSTKALDADCARADADGDYGPLRWWHLPGVDIGDCRFNAMSGRTLIEMGTFRHKALAEAAAAAAADLEISIGFKHLPGEPVAAAPGAPAVYSYIRRFERSLVPKGRASNLFTSFSVTKEFTMDQAKLKAALEKLGNTPEARSMMQDIITQAQTREKEADAAGVAFKDAPAWAQALITRIDALETKLKAPMPPEEMIAAGETEAADGAAEAAEEGDLGGDLMIGDMTPTEFKALMMEVMGDITTKMSQLDAELKGMGYERRMKEQGDTLASFGKKLDAALTTLKELNGDAPATRGRGHRPSEDNPDLEALLDAALKDDDDEFAVHGPLSDAVRFLNQKPG